MSKLYKCPICLAGEHCYGDSNNAECECGCETEENVRLRKADEQYDLENDK